ncbi:MAG TPA: DUF4845 domain-containing protein [Methylophilaceae bacterium]|nr:DUF4845 domain-containing protein [Methylophilaceae bacterium]
MRKQQGMTFLGLIIVLSLVLSVLLAGIKITPAYIEYISVKKALKKIGNESSFPEMSKKEIIDEFDRSAVIDNIEVVKGSDLVISAGNSGQKIVSVEYQVVKPLAGNLSALMDFKASTAK